MRAWEISVWILISTCNFLNKFKKKICSPKFNYLFKKHKNTRILLYYKGMTKNAGSSAMSSGKRLMTRVTGHDVFYIDITVV